MLGSEYGRDPQVLGQDFLRWLSTVGWTTYIKDVQRQSKSLDANILNRQDTLETKLMYV